MSFDIFCFFICCVESKDECIGAHKIQKKSRSQKLMCILFHLVLVVYHSFVALRVNLLGFIFERTTKNDAKMTFSTTKIMLCMAKTERFFLLIFDSTLREFFDRKSKRNVFSFLENDDENNLLSKRLLI